MLFISCPTMAYQNDGNKKHPSYSTGVALRPTKKMTRSKLRTELLWNSVYST